MAVSGKNTVTVHNVLVGEVWLCSGQSNMEFALEGRPGVLDGVKNAAQEVAAADYPRLRLFRVEKAVAGKPQSEVHGQWVVTNPQTVEHFSAARYAWANDRKCNLYNQPGLPAPPFRTDDWRVTSQGEIRKEAPQMW
jgi:hypothetical protein